MDQYPAEAIPARQIVALSSMISSTAITTVGAALTPTTTIARAPTISSISGTPG